jgi:acyl transferase domain-containing protein
MVLCGGADLHNGINDYLMFSSVGVLSRGGKCRTFDADADGIVLGEGISVAVLKRLDDAVRDGDRVYAVIKGVAGTSDGRAVGLTVPHQEGQTRVLRKAYRDAGVSPRDVELVEAHGTGTVVGDRTELVTLTEVFTAAGTQPHSCALGSVKSQIGHTKCAAGMAGLIKAALSIYHRTLPPTLHIENPNPGYDPKTSPFTLSDKSRPWPGTDQKAGLSAFGFGGANFHAVLAAHENGSGPASSLSAWPAELFIFKGKTQKQAQDTAKKIAELIASEAPVRLRDLAHTVSRTGEGPVQFALVARDIEDLQQKLQDQDVFEAADADGRVAFLFPGQGSQRPGMLADLFIAFPGLRRFLDLGGNWLETVFPPESGPEEKQALAETQVAQPAMGMADLAMAELLKLFGIKPDMLAGHSYGELVALCVAGSLLEEELLDLSAARGQAIVEAAGSAKGAMLAVRAQPAELEEIPGVVVANHNAPDQTVLSGPVEAIETAQKTLEARGLSTTRIPVSCAFHSPMVSGASETFTTVLAEKTVRTLEMPVWSNTTSEPYPEKPEAIRARLAEHVRKPVLFADQILAMYEAGARIFVEAGPGRVLTGLVRKILKGKPHTAISCDDPGQPGIESLLLALAQLSVLQQPVDTEALFADRNTRPFDLESPPTRPQSTWLVDGHRAVPLNGDLPDFAMHPVTEPLNITPTPAGGSRETVVLEYLKSMREIVRDQREVMLRYLGAAQAELPAIKETTVVKQIEPEPAPEPETADIGTLLLQIVSERTGYPTDMLDLNLDLAADLSIDSIKRIEIIGELCKRMGLGQGDMARRDEVIEELASQKTLKNILTWLENQKDKATPSQDSTTEPEAEVQETLNRYTLSVEPAPVLSRNGHNTEGKTFALTDDGRGVAKALAERLTDSGATVHLLNGDGMPGKVDGLIHLQSLSPKPGANQVKRLFSLAQEALLDGAGTMLAATGHGGAFGRKKASNNGSFLQGGVSGLVKTVAKEWPEARVRVVDMDPEGAPDQMADTLYEELLSSDDLVEVGHREGVRHVLQPVEAEEEPAVDHDVLDLTEDSVVLLTGGARGITAHVALELARRFRPRLVLLGRSPLPEEESDPELAQAKNLTGLRGVLASRDRRLKPAEIDRQARKILSAREIWNTLAAIREAGAEVEYHPVDVRDHVAFSVCIADLYARHGRIDGVIHGAGVLDDKLIRDKTLESFNRVFDTKVAGALTLAEKLRDDVRFVVFFSSVSGAFGNRGQVDYAAANDALDKLALSLNQRIQGRVVSINWGPWAGTGMVSEQLEAEYKKHGIGIIPPEEGARSLITELGRAGDSDAQVILMRAKPEHFC